MVTVTTVLYVAAFVLTLAAAIGKAPIWIAVLMLCIVGLLSAFPR